MTPDEFRQLWNTAHPVKPPPARFCHTCKKQVSAPYIICDNDCGALFCDDSCWKDQHKCRYNHSDDE